MSEEVTFEEIALGYVLYYCAETGGYVKRLSPEARRAALGLPPVKLLKLKRLGRPPNKKPFDEEVLLVQTRGICVE
jgi:hypothetical protein